MNDRNVPSLSAAAPVLTPLLVAGVLVFLSACASSGKNDLTGFDQLTLAPGDTGNCNSSPCRIFLTIPAGTGTYEVTANETKVGDYPAGQTADLGSYPVSD